MGRELICVIVDLLGGHGWVGGYKYLERWLALGTSAVFGTGAFCTSSYIGSYVGTSHSHQPTRYTSDEDCTGGGRLAHDRTLYAST